MSFDPTNAVMVDEPEEGDLDGLFTDMEKKMRSMRTQLFADVVKEIAKSAKDERKKLLESSAKQFMEVMQPAFDKLAAAMVETVAKKQDALAERLASIETRTKDQHLSVVDRLKNMKAMRDTAEQKTETPPAAQPTDNGALAALQAKIEALHEAVAKKATEPAKAAEAPKPKQWKFRVTRDLHNRITEICADEDMSHG